METKLHTELEDCIQEIPGLGKVLRHPLVYQVPFFNTPFEILHSNKMLEQKQKMIKESLQEKDYSRYVFLHERAYRLNAYIEIEEYLSDEKFWEMFVTVWSDSENIYQIREEWINLIHSRNKPTGKTLKSVLDKKDIKFLDALPDSFEIYRGTCPDETLEDPGLSWTVDRDKAKWFSKRFHKNGVVLKRTVTKKEVLFYYNGRDEKEIILIPEL